MSLQGETNDAFKVEDEHLVLGSIGINLIFEKKQTLYFSEDITTKELTELFEKSAEEICASTDNKWEQAKVALGMAEYDHHSDTSVDDVVRRADKAMYENKRARKEMN